VLPLERYFKNIQALLSLKHLRGAGYLCFEGKTHVLSCIFTVRNRHEAMPQPETYPISSTRHVSLTPRQSHDYTGKHYTYTCKPGTRMER